MTAHAARLPVASAHRPALAGQDPSQRPSAPLLSERFLMNTSSTHLRAIAFGAVIVAVLPYVTLKLMWLSGSTVGLDTSTIGHMQDTRLVVGNVVTVGLEILALGLAFALIRPWGRKIPGWLVFVIAGGATGLLAPLLLGLPVGVLVQQAIEGTTSSGGEGDLQPWVFLVVYAGFGLLAVGLACLLAFYAGDRWRAWLSYPPRRPSLPLLLICGLGMGAFGLAMLSWGVMGPGDTGPQGLTSIAQRSVLVSTGVLTLLGWGVPVLPRLLARHPRSAWLIAWIGGATAALQGPTHVLLAQEGHSRPLVSTLAVVATLSATAYGLALLRSARPDRNAPVE